jgi:hypothetical protein
MNRRKGDQDSGNNPRLVHFVCGTSREPSVIDSDPLSIFTRCTREQISPDRGLTHSLPNFRRRVRPRVQPVNAQAYWLLGWPVRPRWGRAGCDCLDISANGEEPPLKKCDISELVINVPGYSPDGFYRCFYRSVLSTNPEAKHFPSISLISAVAIVIPQRKPLLGLPIKDKSNLTTISYFYRKAILFRNNL